MRNTLLVPTLRMKRERLSDACNLPASGQCTCSRNTMGGITGHHMLAIDDMGDCSGHAFIRRHFGSSVELTCSISMLQYNPPRSTLGFRSACHFSYRNDVGMRRFDNISPFMAPRLYQTMEDGGSYSSSSAAHPFPQASHV